MFVVISELETGRKKAQVLIQYKTFIFAYLILETWIISSSKGEGISKKIYEFSNALTCNS